MFGIYQASTSEMFGKVVEIPQTEKTPFHPRSPYGFAKVYAYWATKNYREAYEMYACSGILFNHESPRRGETFVTRKVVQALDKIAKGEQNVLTLGNLNAKRDWGHAKDYVEAMWLMLQQDKAEDYVIALDEQHSVREFVEEAAPHFGFDIEWFGEGEDEIGMDKKTKKTIIKVDSKYFRPSEVDTLLGDSTKGVKSWVGHLKFHLKNLWRTCVKMESNSRIYVAGNTGMVGSAIIRMLKSKGYENIISSPSGHWDLRRQRMMLKDF